MSDAKELLAEIDTEITAWERGDAEVDAAATTLMRARAWIERWAPVVEAAREASEATRAAHAAFQAAADHEDSVTTTLGVPGGSPIHNTATRSLSAACVAANRREVAADLALADAIAAALGEDKP